MSGIKAGDLVMVVRPTPCCGNTHAIGTTFRVQDVWLCTHDCEHCGSVKVGSIALQFEDNGQLFGFQSSRLIRIDPPARPESVETTEELTA